MHFTQNSCRILIVEEYLLVETEEQLAEIVGQDIVTFLQLFA